MPERTCIGCRVTRDPGGLLRFRRSVDGHIVPATSARTSVGRSAYLCPSYACFQQARKRRAFSRSFAKSGAIHLDPRNDDVWARLWSVTLRDLRDAVERIPTRHPRRRGLEQLLFELSSQPAAPREAVPERSAGTTPASHETAASRQGAPKGEAHHG